jgi:hypothetical protein
MKTWQASRYNFLNPNQLFRYSHTYSDGNEWYENSSPRLAAANDIVKCLRKHFSEKIGTLMDEKVHKGRPAIARND